MGSNYGHGCMSALCAIDAGPAPIQPASRLSSFHLLHQAARLAAVPRTRHALPLVTRFTCRQMNADGSRRLLHKGSALPFVREPLHDLPSNIGLSYGAQREAHMRGSAWEHRRADLLPVEVGSSGKLIHFLVGKIRLLRVQSDPFLKNPRLSRRVVRPFCSALALGLVHATTVRLLAALMSGFIVAKSYVCRWRHKVCLRRHNRIACIDA